MAAFGFVVQIAIGAIFLYSGLAKLRVGRFALDLADYELLPDSLIAPVAAVLPWVETIVGLSLLAGIAATASSWVAVALMILFALAISINLNRGHRNACGCQGSTKQIDWALAARNVGLAAVTAMAAVSAGPSSGLRALWGANPHLSSTSSRSAVVVSLLVVLGAHVALAVRRFSEQLERSHIPTFVGGES